MRGEALLLSSSSPHLLILSLKEFSMLPQMTPAVRRALDAARVWAARLGTGDVAPFHLLCGLLEEEEGRAIALLLAAEVDVESLRRDLGFGLSPELPLPVVTRPFSEIVERLLFQARDLATMLSADRSISSVSLLLTLVRADEELRRTLEQRGLDFVKLESSVLALAGPPLRLEAPLQLAEPSEQLDAARV